MITPEKTYTNNPFVDNIIYYSKLLAINCSVKDEDEALANETKESIEKGDILISCVEKTATFELFDSYPKEILEKYIPVDSNLNIFVSNVDALKTYLNTFNQNVKKIYYDNLSEIARNVYMDHYNVMNNYLESVEDTWADDNETLYNNCLGATATYEDLFDIIPKYTRTRIVLKYLNNYDDRDLTQYCGSLSDFQNYVNTRTDAQINTELANISKAMRDVFISHYDIMIERGLIRKATDKKENFINSAYLYNACRDKSTNFYALYDAFPEDVINSIIDTLFGDNYINAHSELTGLEFINKYELKSDKDKLLDFASSFHTTLLNDIYDKYMENNPNTVLDENGVNNDVLSDIMNSLDNGDFYFDATEKLTEVFINTYLENYRSFIDGDIYDACFTGIIEYYDLIEYLPIETQKMILNTQFKEFTNIEVYSKSKYMLNSYLTTLSVEDRNYIKNNITKDMMEWYPNHYEELNNYYRSFIGLPPIDDDGNVCEDTLIHSWDEKTKSFIEFGDYFLNKIPDNIYPEIHWKQKIHEFDNYDIGILTECGILDEYASMCNSNINSSRYKYLRYLADNKLDIYQCRKAMQFDLIGIPTIDDEDARKRFVDAYFVNREYIVRDVYSDAYKFQSDYYNKFIIIFIIINTIMDMLSNITTMIIDREVFDHRCIKWLFESFGVPFYSEIPLKYLRAMLKNLNLLLKYKSSTKNMIDICKLFGFSDVRVFNYYLFKERIKDSNTGEYIFDENNEISYNINNLWVKVYSDQENIYPEDISDIYAAEPINGIFDSYEVLNAEDPYDSYTIIPNKYCLHYDLKIRDEDLIIYIDDLYSMDMDSDVVSPEKIYISYLEANFINDTNTTNLDNDILRVVRDYNGVYYIKLLDYQHYDKDKYTKEIRCMSNGRVVKRRIIKNDADVYVKDLNFNAFYKLQDSTYFSEIKANTNPAELKFIKVPINESFAEYKNDENYIVSYDEITLNDEGNTWDGGRIHEELYQKLTEHNFNAVKSKYISVETVTDLTEQCFQVSYFYNMLFDNLYSEDLLTVKIPFIKMGHNFRFMDVICYLFSLMYFYNGLEDNIMYSPTQILFIKGYNFDKALNEITSNDFNINDEIKNNNYNYQDAFNNYSIKSFNLEADIDELDKWLQENCYMSLDDFIVDDSLINFNQIITLRQFFTLNNSYYQKNIFKDNVITLPYNQNIKTSYGMELYSKVYIVDIDNNIHEYVKENGNWIEIINSFNNELYLIDSSNYIIMPDGKKHALYEKYILSNTTIPIMLQRHIPTYFYYDNGEFKLLFTSNICIVDDLGRCIFSADNIYSKNSNGEYVEITDNYLISIRNSVKYIEWYPYWIKNEIDNSWKLNKNIAYVKVTQNNITTYVKYTEAYNHQNTEFNDNDLWIKHSDGHFIKFTETDFYRTSHPEGIIDENLDNKIFEYYEEEGYVQVNSNSNGAESDTDPNGVTRYFKKISDFYTENNWNYNSNTLYFLIDDNYIPDYELLSPYNCYIENNGNYGLVIDNCASYKQYDDLSIKNTQSLLILDDDYDYKKYYTVMTTSNNYFYKDTDENIDKRYVYNSDTDYITVFHSNNTYDETKSIITVFNKSVTSSTSNDIISSNKYNPELTDKVWDENDWFYEDPEFESSGRYTIGINGENIWYYRKPGSQITPEDDIEYDPVGSGMYMESFAYIGDTHLIEGNRYYMAFDIETNFTGKIQIFNTADDSVNSNEDKIYEISKGDKQHISQVFIANNNETPEIRFIIYDFKEYPINIGDYIIISNIRFIKGYSDNFIAQDIPSYDKIQELYRTNEAIYKYITKCMAEETDLKKYKIYKKIYDSLMISKYNKEAFKIGDNEYAKTYTDFIKNRDAVLYARLNRFKNLDPDSMHKEIADEIVEITYAIDDCVDTYSYGFLYSYFPAVSANYIQQYITKLINWFKSWKVHLLGINTLYSLGDASENTIRALEDQEYKMRYDNIKTNCYIHGTVKVNPLDDYNISGVKYNTLYIFDDYTNSLKDQCLSKDRVRIISTTANSLEYTDSNSQLKLVFNDINNKTIVENDNIMKISSGSSGFTIGNNNDIIINTDENDQVIISEQIIDEINLYSSDYIDWRSILNE